MTPISLVVTPPPSAKMTYKRPIPAATYYINPLTVAPDPPRLSLVLCLVRITNEGEALAYDYP